jgi:antitoxin HigA-1
MKENMAKRMAPVHPGMFLKELMTEFGLTQYALAKAIGVQPIRIGQIVAGKRAVTPDTALRLARYFGSEAKSWVNWQSHYDLEVAAQLLEAKIKRDVVPMKAAA